MTQVDDLTATLMAELSKYTAEVVEEVKQDCRDVSAEMTDNIKRDSPKKTGDYAKGWKAKVEFEDKNNIRITTYNATDYQLTHLLEFGWAKTNGGRVEGRPHIAPNEEKAKTELVKRIEKAVSAK
jgi:hypothetical protein